MKKIILMVTRCLVLGAVLSPPAFSVVPYPLSMEEGSAPGQESVAKSTSSKSVSQVADKLAEDERRLESVLQDLKEDRKALKQADPKESQNGHSLR